MITNLISPLVNWMTAILSQVGYPVIFILMFLESALIPIPSEVTMPFAGFLAAQGSLSFWPVVAVGALANLAGSLAAYALGYWGQEEAIEDLIRKYGKYLLITYREVERAKRWFREKGEEIVFASRLLPVVRTFISLPAGFAEMNVFKFSLLTLAGSFLWSMGLTYLGWSLGENWSLFGRYFHRFGALLMILILISVGLFFKHKLGKIKKSK